MELLVFGAVLFGGWRIKKYFEEKDDAKYREIDRRERRNAESD